MAHPGFYRNFERVIAGLLAAGVNVHVRFSKQHETITMDDYSIPSSEGGGRLGVSFQKTTQVRSPAERIRLVRDIIFYTRPHFARASDLVSRFGSLQKPGVLARPAQLLLR